MKLTSILRPNVIKLSPSDIKQTVMSEDCTIGEAFTMIESWCNDNNANYPSICDLWKDRGIICVEIRTHDNKYINIFNIEE